MVQVQKEKVKLAILEEAKKEFITYGYQLASMRRIAKASNTTVGNIYKYFESKEELFEGLISPAKNWIYDYIQDKADVSYHAERDGHADLQEFAVIISEFRDEVLLLTDGASGTKYENIKEQILKMIAYNIQLYLTVVYNEEKKYSHSPETLARTIAVAILEGLLDILRQHTKKDEIKQATISFNLFMFRNYLK